MLETDEDADIKFVTKVKYGWQVHRQGWKNHDFLKQSKKSDFFDLNRIFLI